MIAGASFINKKNKRTRILKKISPKNIHAGSRIRDLVSGKIHPRFRIPEQRGKKAVSQIRIHNTVWGSWLKPNARPSDSRIQYSLKMLSLFIFWFSSFLINDRVTVMDK
jgi:hypothetical protein